MDSELNLPRQEDVESISDDVVLAELALSMYADEPCRICGKLLAMDDLKNGAVFAGKSFDNKSRAAHGACWEKNVPKSEWAFPIDG